MVAPPVAMAHDEEPNIIGNQAVTIEEDDFEKTKLEQTKTRRCLPVCCSAFYFVLAVTQLIFAAATGHAWGAFLGALLLVAIGIMVIVLPRVLPVTAPRTEDPNSTPVFKRRVSLAGALNFKDRVFPRLVQRVFGLGVIFIGGWCFSLLFINVFCAVSDPGWEKFPESCPKDIDGCTRVAFSKRRRGGGLQPLYFAGTTAEGVASVVKEWFPLPYPADCDWDDSWEYKQNSANTGVPLPTIFLRAACRTPGWNFVDDIGWNLMYNGTGVFVEAQSQLRMGKGDMGVNDYRVLIVWNYLRNHFRSA